MNVSDFRVVSISGGVRYCANDVRPTAIPLLKGGANGFPFIFLTQDVDLPVHVFGSKATLACCLHWP